MEKSTDFERSKRSMDEMKIVSKFTTNMISKLVKMVLRKKLGYDIDIQLNEIKTTITEIGRAHV